MFIISQILNTITEPHPIQYHLNIQTENIKSVFVKSAKVIPESEKQLKSDSKSEN